MHRKHAAKSEKLSCKRLSVVDCERCKAERAASEAERVLVDANTPFSDDGYEVLHDELKYLIRELVDESCRIADRHTAGSISAEYVRRARSNLFSTSRGRWVKHTGLFGGLFLGTGLSSLMTVSGPAGMPPSPAGWFSIILCFAVGTGLIAWSIARD